MELVLGSFEEHVEQAELESVRAAYQEGRVTALTGETTIAPGVTGIPVGGHAPGQQIVVVETAGGSTVVLASDAVHLCDKA